MWVFYKLQNSYFSFHLKERGVEKGEEEKQGKKKFYYCKINIAKELLKTLVKKPFFISLLKVMMFLPMAVSVYIVLVKYLINKW